MSKLSNETVIVHIREFLKKMKMEYNADFYVVLYTAIGKIVCDLEPPATKSSLLSFTDDPASFSVDISAVFDETGLFDDQLINAKNVIVYNNDSDVELMRTEQMVIFARHVVGFNLIRKQPE